MPTCRFFGHRPPNVRPGSVRIEQLSGVDGHFAAIVEDGPATAIYVSHDGVTQVFYVVHHGRFHWGTNVSEVVRAAALPWRWNYEALGDFAVFGHLLGNGTLHPDVARVAAGELVRWDGKSLTRVVLPRQHFEPSGPDAAIDILVDSVRNQTHPDDVISMSAGFDSRLILAAHLSLGLKPRLLVMGPPKTTDLTIALTIAKRLRLDIQQVPLTGTWMLRDRFDISRETSGTKTVENWHTYEYVAASGHKSGIWIGSNGEFARTFFVDRGAAFLTANALGHLAIDSFWKAKLSRSAIPSTMISCLAAPFADSLASSGHRMRRLYELFPQASLGLVNDALYRERVRQFISNGLRLVSLNATPKTPFLDPRWIEVIRRLPRMQKLGNWWHRFAIGKLAPHLLDFPFDTSGVPMRTRPGLGYWLGLSPHSVNIPYFQYGSWFNQCPFVEAMNQALPFADDLFNEPVKAAGLSVRATAFLAALGFFRQMECQEVSMPTSRSILSSKN